VALTIANPTQSITIHQPVTIASSSGVTASTFDFNIVPYAVNNITIPNAYVFTAISIPPGAFSTWNWDFGDNTCPGPQPCSGSPAVHIYPDAKNYTVTLTVPGQPKGVSKTIIPRHRASGR
jgi:PKD repeat protein